MELMLADEQATEQLGARVCAVIEAPAMLFLRGALGAGKTTLSRGLLQAAGHAGVVKSPTYTLCEPYSLSSTLFLHCDFYRLSGSGEVEFLGLADQFGEDTIVLIEWPEIAAADLPPPDLDIELLLQGDARLARVQSATSRGIGWLERLG